MLGTLSVCCVLVACALIQTIVGHGNGETDIPRTNTERKLSASVKSSSFVKSNKIRFDREAFCLIFKCNNKRCVRKFKLTFSKDLVYVPIKKFPSIPRKPTKPRVRLPVQRRLEGVTERGWGVPWWYYCWK